MVERPSSSRYQRWQAMNAMQATVGIVQNFGPLTVDRLVAITGWDKHYASRKVDNALRLGHLTYASLHGRRELVLSGPVRVKGL